MVGKWGRACHLSHIKPTYTYWLCSWEIRLVSSNLGPLVPHYLMIRNWGNEPDPRLSCVMFGVGGSAGDGGRMTGRWDRASQSVSQSGQQETAQPPVSVSQLTSPPGTLLLTPGKTEVQKIDNYGRLHRRNLYAADELQPCWFPNLINKTAHNRGV